MLNNKKTTTQKNVLNKIFPHGRADSSFNLTKR